MVAHSLAIRFQANPYAIQDHGLAHGAPGSGLQLLWLCCRTMAITGDSSYCLRKRRCQRRSLPACQQRQQCLGADARWSPEDVCSLQTPLGPLWKPAEARRVPPHQKPPWPPPASSTQLRQRPPRAPLACIPHQPMLHAQRLMGTMVLTQGAG